MSDALRKVREIDVCSPEELPLSVLRSTEPLLLKGLINKWSMVESGKVGDQVLKQQILSCYQGKEIGAFLGDGKNNGRYFYNDSITGFNFSKQKVRLDQLLAQSEAFDHVTDSPTYYVGSVGIDGWLPGLRQSNDLPALKDFNPLVSIWMGNRSRIAAHQDAPQNIACCVAGKRRFTLFPPEQLENLYIGPLDFTPAGQAVSLVDFHQPDFQTYPRFKRALESALVAELEPGDALLLPSMWWHHVESEGNFNVLVNYWWNETAAHIGAPMDALQHSIMNIRHLPLEQRKAWQVLFDYYVFADEDLQYEHIPDVAKGPLAGVDEQMARQMKSYLLNKLNR